MKTREETETVNDAKKLNLKGRKGELNESRPRKKKHKQKGKKSPSPPVPPTHIHTHPKQDRKIIDDNEEASNSNLRKKNR